ncbi:MAG TPA: alpha-L-fucosidase [Limnochordia bacterium]|nr:alpha-L-fucosidase [Limnochordia bacterium]
MAPHLPTPQQLRWQDLEFGLFVHFGINTFTGREWGDGTEDPALFYPTALDCRQWARVAKEAGMRYAILTAKHHDGFCLWPTETTAHSVKSSPWRDGKGDVVREFVDACREEGILPGLYCSPWDRNAPCYSDPKAYSEFYARQLEELCSNYGPLVQLWFDGAGSEGYTYDWDRIIGTVRRLQPDAVIFQMGDPDVRWGGNELGYGSPDLWTTVDASRLDVLWESPRRELPPQGRFLPVELDTTINRAGWFWHPNTTDQIKSLDELIGIYYRSVGHGANLLLNVAPNREGRLEEAEVQRLLELGAEIRRRFGNPLAVAGPGAGELEIVLREPALVARFEAMEDLSQGESVLEWVLEAQVGQDGLGRPAWHRLAHGYALGHKRLGDFPPIVASRFRLRVIRSRGEARLRSLKVFAP